MCIDGIIYGGFSTAVYLLDTQYISPYLVLLYLVWVCVSRDPCFHFPVSAYYCCLLFVYIYICIHTYIYIHTCGLFTPPPRACSISMCLCFKKYFVVLFWAPLYLPPVPVHLCLPVPYPAPLTFPPFLRTPSPLPTRSLLPSPHRWLRLPFFFVLFFFIYCTYIYIYILVSYTSDDAGVLVRLHGRASVSLGDVR